MKKKISKKQKLVVAGAVGTAFGYFLSTMMAKMKKGSCGCDGHDGQDDFPGLPDPAQLRNGARIPNRLYVR